MKKYTCITCGKDSPNITCNECAYTVIDYSCWGERELIQELEKRDRQLEAILNAKK